MWAEGCSGAADEAARRWRAGGMGCLGLSVGGGRRRPRWPILTWSRSVRAGGQALGLQRAGFEPRSPSSSTVGLCHAAGQRPGWKLAEGDAADPALRRPRDYRTWRCWRRRSLPAVHRGGPGARAPTSATCSRGPSSCAGPSGRGPAARECPGTEHDQVQRVPRAVLDRLRELGYVPGWRLPKLIGFLVPQLRPRTVLVALRPADARWLRWPSPSAIRRDGRRDPGRPDGRAGLARRSPPGPAGRPDRADHRRRSKKHGRRPGPTRAKRAWAELGVDGISIADAAPGRTPTRPCRPG